jgi:DNA-binding GntR family transcriptional regulator
MNCNMTTSTAALGDLAPIEHPTLGSKAYLDLRNLIMSGRLAPGDRLPLRSVAQALGVSIMPVRDAVSRLVAEQALVMTPSRAVHVPVMKPEEFQELATIRAVLEGFAAEQAALRRTPAELTQMFATERTYRAECMRRPTDPAKALPLNMDFHFAIYRAAKLPRLLEIIEALWLRVGPIFIIEARSSPERLEKGSAHLHHGHALAAIEAGDGAAAREAIASDIRAAASYILTRTRLGGGTMGAPSASAGTAQPFKSTADRRRRRKPDP